MYWLTNLFFYLFVAFLGLIIVSALVFQKLSTIFNGILPTIIIALIYSASKKGKYPFSLLGVWYLINSFVAISLAFVSGFPSLNSVVAILLAFLSAFAFYHLTIRKKTKLEWLEIWSQKKDKRA